MDVLGNESGISNEASYAMPVAPAALTLQANSVGQFSFNVSGDAGQSYVVQASTNLLDWVSIQTHAAPFLFKDTMKPGDSRLQFDRAFYLKP